MLKVLNLESFEGWDIWVMFIILTAKSKGLNETKSINCN